MTLERLSNVETLEHAAEIYLAKNGNHEAAEKVTIEEAERYNNSTSFIAFLELNQIATYESELRNAV